jgi:catechol 2,3-dioxygenase
VAGVPGAQLTHVGVYVDDMDAMVAFYTGLLGLIVSDQGSFGGRRLTFLTRKADEHHQIVLIEGRVAAEGTQVLAQVSFLVDDLAALRTFRAHALDLGAKGVEARNHGNSWSLYFFDPEGNKLELYCVTPWHVTQPWRVPLDLDRSDEEIRAETERLLAEGAEWQPRGQRIDAMTRRLADAGPEEA